MPELRKDPIVNRWVIFSPERGKRPQDFPPPSKKHNRGACPFCYGNEASTPPEILAFRPGQSTPNSSGWTLRVVPNKYPALRLEGDMEHVKDGLHDHLNGIGSHEVIIESPEHEMDLEMLSQEQIEECLRAFKLRIQALKRDSRLQYIQVFKNHGEAAGATLEHTHSQLIALPIVPDLVGEEVAGARRYFDSNAHCIYCRIISQDKSESNRLVTQNESFVTLCPYAPRFPFEMWLLPRNHISRFEDLEDNDLFPLAGLLRESLLKMRIALGKPAYNFFLHTSPVKEDHHNHYHWHIEIMPKLTKLAGFEQGTGFYINPVFPELAAETLRNTKT